MTAILSCTGDDLYLFNLPFAIYSWHQIGCDCAVFIPRALAFDRRFSEVMRTTKNARSCHCFIFKANLDKQATYAQCARLYAAATGRQFYGSEMLITSDADMCVFNEAWWEELTRDTRIKVVGADLVPAGQFPMCYIAMQCARWKTVMGIGPKDRYQDCLDRLLKHLEAEHFRGNYWSKDQETIYNAISTTDYNIELINRAKPGTQFATRRADRDGWEVTADIIDAHLPRPGWTDENFSKIYMLFAQMYPDADLGWMDDYRAEYL